MSQHSKNYTGEYPAQVVSVNDPEHAMRVQVKVFELFDGVPQADLPWATCKMSFGTREGNGGLIPVQAGDYVWVDFPFSGDTRRPRITGGMHYNPGGTPQMPPELWAGPGQYVHKRTPDEPVPEAPEYHKDVVFRQNNVLIQITASGALRATQETSGTAIEIAPNGAIVLHSEKDVFCSAQGNCLFDVKGDYELRVGGQAKLQAAGTMSVGSSAAGLALSAATQGTMTGGGGLNFTGPTTFEDNVTAKGDMNVSGAVTDGGGNTNHHTH